MIKKYYTEFTKLYGRMMKLEIQIKKKLIFSVLSYYGENVLAAFHKFFYNKRRIERYRTNNGNTILAILKNPQITNAQKFTQLINAMYLSDILFIVLCCKEFYKEEVTMNFYSILPDKFSKLTQSRHTLQDLRNTIAHYNFKDFEQNKQNYLEALSLFEYHIE